MKNYRYKLQPYAGMASRYTCPRCKTPHKFVRYIDTLTGQQINEAVGRCERVDSCGSHYTPAQYFRDNGIIPSPDPLINQAPGPRENFPFTFSPALITSAHPEASADNTNLLRFISAALQPSPAQLHALIDAYHLRAASYGRIIFPQIDCLGNCRTAKVMQYNLATGHRLKDTKGSFNWIHRILIKQGKLPPNFKLRQCLFGEHMLIQRPDCAVVVVESEKTALICTLIYPAFLWLATGGKFNFNADRFHPLANRIIYAIPDAGSLRYWVEKSREISRQLSCRIRVSDCVQYAANLADIAAGIDIADLILRGQTPHSF